jgi:hypothetical protein
MMALLAGRGGWVAFYDGSEGVNEFFEEIEVCVGDCGSSRFHVS